MINIYILMLIIIGVNSYAHIDKLCTDKNDRDACNNIERNQTYECAENIVSKIDCILNIEKGQHQFAIVEPEQALLAVSFVSDNVVVLGEVTAEQSPYQTVVIVRAFYNNSFEDLRGKRFCHPGFKHDELITRYVLQEFENKIIQTNKTFCAITEGMTVAERRLSVLSSFFSSSCRPGPWVDDDANLDGNLKTKYSNLCDLCGPEKCDVNYQVPFNDSLRCLSQNGGDIAVTSLTDAITFLQISNNRENFKFLCSDGSTKPLGENCTWTNQLNRLIITEKTVANDPRNFLEYHLPNHFKAFAAQALSSNVLLTDSLETLLELSKEDHISFIDPVPLKTYVSAHRTIPQLSDNTFCNVTVDWCTVNKLEQQKCHWLQQAALNTGLNPVIRCIQSRDNDTVSCLNDVQVGKADVVFADITYGYIALKKSLTSVAYPETYNKDLATVVVVLRNDTTDINSLGDLNGRGACFPQYGGREWLAFIDAMKSKTVMKKSCDYGQLFSDFVGSSCVPGARDRDYNFETGDADKLCDQCLPTVNNGPAKYCNADDINKYYGTDGALKCLENKGGDYAVVTLKDVKEFRDQGNSFKVLAQNGSVAKYTGFLVDSNAALTIITSGEMVVENTTKKRADIIQLLKGIELEFGQTLKKTFKVFEKFNGNPDLLFPDSTPGLTFDDNETGKYVDNFKKLLRNSEQCLVSPDGAANLIPSLTLMMLLIVTIRFYIVWQ